ncbi:MAG: 50S ribosomal protein L25 [Candidatus Parcubacteria bacterium]|nr:50S ribosomal protein L25 [Candidatus Parcubacteria bacterium]
MTSFILKAQERTILGKKVKSLKNQDLIPAVLYGHGIKNQNLAVNVLEFKKLFDAVGTSKLVDLHINDKKPVKILVHDVQYDPIKTEVNHIDFYQIKEDEKITTEIELEFIGEAPAVKELGGVLVKTYDAIEIECLPAELEKMDKIRVDLSVLKTFADSVHIKDLQVPAGVRITVDPDEVVALIEEIAEEKVEEVKPIESVEGIVKEGAADVKEGAEKAEGAGKEKAQPAEKKTDKK